MSFFVMIIIIINIKTAFVGYVFVVVKIHYDLQVRREN